jgi:hypothetical protein
MALNDTLLNIGVTAMQAAATHLSLHSATPNASGSNETTAARVAASWGTAANGDFATLSNKNFTGGAASGAVAAVGLWSAPTGGTFYGYFPITGDAAFNSAGEYTLVSLTIPGTAT